MERTQFVKEVAKKMRNNMCDLFIGSGISAPSGLPTWSAFLSPYLSELGLRLHEEDNLPLLAQYVVNRNSGNRNIISESVHNTFAPDYPLNKYHTTIANFPIKTIWTTNYDCLLEKTFSDRETRVVTSEDNLLHPHNNIDVEIVKLHGCAKHAAKEIILTQADYDCFLYEKPKISQRLREAIINRSIFFLGYSYHDPNIQVIMTQAYQMMDKITNTHYILINDIEQGSDETDEKFTQRKIRFKLWISELNRIGIRELVVPRSEIGSVLKEIDQESHESAVFVTGSHKVDSKAEEYARTIGKTLAAMSDVILNNGQSSGIGNAVLSSFMQYTFDHKQDVYKRVRIFPNPYAISPDYADNPELLPNLKMARLPLIAHSTIVIVFPGNIGTNAEIELARAKGRPVFPILWDIKQYNTLAISNLMADQDNVNILKEVVPDYCDKLLKKEIPTETETIEAMRKIINGKVSHSIK